jgi:hypothetical protein
VTCTMCFPAPRSLTAPQQFLHLRSNPVCGGTGRLSCGGLAWRYTTSPTLLSRLYSVRIAYRHGQTPRVYIDAPDLVALADGRRLPHVYQQSPPCLCLYLPTAGEWTPSMRIDQTIVPWTALWLFYFEEWLISDQWKGEGVHPPPSTKRRRGRRRSIGVQTRSPQHAEDLDA